MLFLPSSYLRGVLVAILLMPLIDIFNRKNVEAALQGSALLVGPNQFSAIIEFYYSPRIRTSCSGDTGAIRS